MKYIKAIKCGDKEWVVQIINSQVVDCESDVYKLIKQEGCKVKFKNKEGTDEIISIFAE